MIRCAASWKGLELHLFPLSASHFQTVQTFPNVWEVKGELIPFKSVWLEAKQ